MRNGYKWTQLDAYKTCIKDDFTHLSTRKYFHQNEHYSTIDCDTSLTLNTNRVYHQQSFLTGYEFALDAQAKVLTDAFHLRTGLIFQRCMNGKSPFDVDATLRGGREAMCERAKNTYNSIGQTTGMTLT